MELSFERISFERFRKGGNVSRSANKNFRCTKSWCPPENIYAGVKFGLFYNIVEPQMKHGNSNIRPVYDGFLQTVICLIYPVHRAYSYCAMLMWVFKCQGSSPDCRWSEETGLCRLEKCWTPSWGMRVSFPTKIPWLFKVILVMKCWHFSLVFVRFCLKHVFQEWCSPLMMITVEMSCYILLQILSGSKPQPKSTLQKRHIWRWDGWLIGRSKVVREKTSCTANM